MSQTPEEVDQHLQIGCMHEFLIICVSKADGSRRGALSTVCKTCAGLHALPPHCTPYPGETVSEPATIPNLQVCAHQHSSAIDWADKSTKERLPWVATHGSSLLHHRHHLSSRCHEISSFRHRPMLPQRVCCAWRGAMPVQHARVPEQAQESTPPNKN